MLIGVDSRLIAFLTEDFFMQLSHYLKIYSYEEKPGHLLFFSTRTGSTTLLRKEDYESIKKGSISPADGEVLLKLGIVVPDQEAEKASLQTILDSLNENNKGLNITVVLNLDCNFACTYCYEGELKGKLYMSDETAGRLVRFIKKRYTANKKFINVDFYGGEPLLSPDIIKKISRDLKSFAESRSAAYTFTLISNGSLYKRRLVEELAALGLQSVKITLDGPADVHDKCRPFKSGGGSFGVIMRNIKETHDLAKIGIGGNFLRDNYEQFPMLLDRLQRENLGPGAISVIKFDPVMNRFDGAASRIDYTDGVMSINDPWLVSAGAYLREEILKRGFHTPKITPMPCQVELDDYYIVNFDGLIYKCPAFIGRPGFEIGDLEAGTRDYRSSYRLGHWKNDECRECEYLPLCFGGCRHMAYLRDGNIDTVDCKKPYLDASLEILVKQDVKYRRPAGAS
jgi:uncharacterized protein